MNERSANRTLLLSVLMSAPGPLILGLGLLAGRSATQIADFLRRTAELAAITASWLAFRRSRGDERLRARYARRCNLFVGAVMCLSGAVMLTLSFFSGGEKGNVVPALVIALLGVIANGLFFRKYTRLSRSGAGAIVSVQARLYGAKTLVDTCVTAALAAVAFFPASAAAHYLDMGGSAVVSVYLAVCGVRTIRESTRAA